MKQHPEEEIERLGSRFGHPETLEFVLDDIDFKPLGGKRKAEVAMAIRRPNGKILLQTKEFYPTNLFRLPTGGLKAREDIEAALLRETEEETALSVRIRDFSAVLNYLADSGEPVFRSYLFLLDESGGVLQEYEPKERISGWMEAAPAQLQQAAEQLRSCKGRWKNWGRFRALVIDALLARQPWP